MRQILWFRRDLRVTDNAILANAKDEVLPIFIFDLNILEKLPKDDKRVTFIYKSVISLKNQLKSLGLDLKIFYGRPIDIFKSLQNDFDEVLCSIDFDDYAKKRDEEIEQIIPLRRFLDSFITNPKEHLKADGTPYKVFTAYYKSMHFLTSSKNIKPYEINKNIKLIEYDYETFPTLKEIGFEKRVLPDFLEKSVDELKLEFTKKIKNYKENRDYFYKDGTSNFSIFLRFGVVSPKELFNFYSTYENSEFFIRQLFWREFYNYLLYHYPKSEFENFNGLKISWNENEEDFIKWCEGNTGVPIVDAAMRHLNKTGMMHNRLRMIVCSFLTKNLFIDWRKGEKYFALKLLDYEVSSNIASWQWGASTGADAAPYFRVFNPYVQSQKFDKDGIFIKSVIKDFNELDYPKAIVDVSLSRKMAIAKFKEAKND